MLIPVGKGIFEKLGREEGSEKAEGQKKKSGEGFGWGVEVVSANQAGIQHNKLVLFTTTKFVALYPRFSANYLHTDEEAGQERVGGGRRRHGSQLFNGSMTAAGRRGVFLLGPPTSFSISPQLQLPFHPGTSCFSCRWGGERP